MYVNVCEKRVVRGYLMPIYYYYMCSDLSLLNRSRLHSFSSYWWEGRVYAVIYAIKSLKQWYNVWGCKLTNTGHHWSLPDRIPVHEQSSMHRCMLLVDLCTNWKRCQQESLSSLLAIASKHLRRLYSLALEKLK